MSDQRRATAKKLISLEHKIADDVADIDGLKDELRAIATEAGAGFTEEFAEEGKVKVSAGSEKEFKGTMPALVPEVFLDLPAQERQRLIKKGIVLEERQYTRGSKPSVSVELA